MPFGFLLALQAAGMIVDWFGTRNQQAIGDYGAKIQQQGIEANIQSTRLETEDASLQALKTLRQNIGSQIAIFAARGTSTSAGSAVGFVNESSSNFKADERMRRLNLLGREATIKAGGTIAKLNQQASNAQLWQGFASRTLNRIPTNPQAWGQIGKSFGLTQIGS